MEITGKVILTFYFLLNYLYVVHYMLEDLSITYGDEHRWREKKTIGAIAGVGGVVYLLFMIWLWS